MARPYLMVNISTASNLPTAMLYAPSDAEAESTYRLLMEYAKSQGWEVKTPSAGEMLGALSDSWKRMDPK